MLNAVDGAAAVAVAAVAISAVNTADVAVAATVVAAATAAVVYDRRWSTWSRVALFGAVVSSCVYCELHSTIRKVEVPKP